MSYRLIILFFILSQWSHHSFGQFKEERLYGWEINNSLVGNVEFTPSDNSLGFPIISLYELTPLVLKFDMLTIADEQMVYSIELCNSDWSPSGLDEMEYIEGYSDNYFDAFSSSFNTTIDYVHYRLSIPNDDIRFIKSGNYILNVYKAEAKEKVLSRRFIVYEPMVELEAEIDKFRSDEYSGYQPISVTIKPQTLDYSELVGNIQLAVQQNGNWNIINRIDRFNTDGKGNLILNASDELRFEGLNEYRFFDIKSLKFISERVDRIEFKNPHYHIYLKPDKLRGDKNYFSSIDLSGQYYIWNQESNDDDLLDADYVYVHFALDTEIPIASEVFIEGAISDWRIDSSSMSFNGETGMYEFVQLLKQGIYNYRYVTKDFNSNLVYFDITEGSYFQTGNDYRTFLYYREPGDISDRVIGYSLLTTGEKAEEYDEDAELNVIQQILKEIAPN